MKTGEEQKDREVGETKPGRVTLVLALVTLIAAFGSSFQYGYNVSVINSPYLLMQDFYNETYMERKGQYMDENLMTLLWSLTVSFFPLGGFFGSLLVGPMVNKFGRKGTLLINNIFSIVPAILMGSARVAKTFEVIIEDQAEKAEGRMSVITLFTYRGLRWQLISIIVMMMGQQLSGVNAVYYYADKIYKSAGVDEYNVQFVTVGTGAVNVVMTFLAVLLLFESRTYVPGATLDALGSKSGERLST